MNARITAPINATGHCRSVRGFTLIEVMVAMTIGLVILLGLTVLFSNNTRNSSELERTGRQLEGARYAVDALANDLHHAGFYGEINPNDLGSTFTDPDPCSTNAALGWDTSGLAPIVPSAVRGVPATVDLGCLDHRLAGTEAVTVRRASTGDELTLASMTADNLYIQVSRCSDDVKQIAAATTSAPLTLRNLNCTAAVDSVRRYVTRTYYIASCDDCNANDGIPTLKRVELIDGALRTTAIAEGVENMQLEYGVDTTAPADGNPDEYVTAAQVNGTPAARVWANVVSVRVHMLSRNTETTPGYTDPRTYQLGQVTVVPSTSVASYKRTLMTETVRLPNVGDR